MAQNDVWVDVAVEMGDCWVAGKKNKKKQKHFSSHFSSSNLCLWKVSLKVSTERRASAFDGDLLPRTGTYTSFKMHWWLHASPVRCRNILCWSLSRQRPLGRSRRPAAGSNEATADKNENVPWKLISLDSETPLCLLVSLGQMTFKPHARKKLGL